VTLNFCLASILADTAGLSYNEGGLHVLAELTLILVLAADASQISFDELKKQKSIPLRLLLIGLPLNTHWDCGCAYGFPYWMV